MWYILWKSNAFTSTGIESEYSKNDKDGHFGLPLKKLNSFTQIDKRSLFQALGQWGRAESSAGRGDERGLLLRKRGKLVTVIILWH